MGTVVSLNISEIRGVEKLRVSEAEIVEGWGVKGDAHGEDWDAQVSLLPVEAMGKIPLGKWTEVSSGGYTENVTISGIPLEELATGRIVRIGKDASIKIHHVGKTEFKEHGRPYIVSREGRFCIVTTGGKVKIGDEVEVLEE